jgi:hypothetical protein
VGWLRDLMTASGPELKSFDRLAKRCLEADGWPEVSRMEFRSLGALFGKLDRDEQLEWLATRPAVQGVLAEVLGASRDSIAAALKPSLRPAPGRLVTWESMPYARALDLLEEEPLPGVPERVRRPGTWGRLVWIAPHGAGRSLTGLWLEARGLARSLPLQRWSREAIPVARPLFVELESAEGLSLEGVPPGICVAVPAPAGIAEAKGTELVRSAPLHELVEELVSWAVSRLSARAELDRDALVAYLRNVAVPRGFAESAGDVFGLVGLADELGVKALGVTPPRKAAREWLKRRAAERVDQTDPSALWLRRSGYDGLLGLVTRVLTEAGPSLFAPRELDAWAELLPAELRRSPDPEWLRLVLAESGAKASERELERALSKLPAGAFETLRAFERAGVLRRTEGDRLALGPHAVIRVVAEEALSALTQGAAFEWGDLLLSREHAPRTMERLFERATRGALRVDDLVDPEADENPGYAAAIEGALRALGLAALLGAEPVTEELTSLWDEAMRLLLELPGELPLPRIGPVSERAADRGGWVLGNGAYLLAALSFSEGLSESDGARVPLLRPWHAKSPPEALHRVLDAIAAALDEPAAPRELAGKAVLLVDRLRAALGPLGEGGGVHRLERAAVAVDEAALGVLSWTSVAAMAHDAVAAAGVRELLSARRLERSDFAAAVVQAYRDAPPPRAGAAALFDPVLTPLVWPFASPEIAADIILEARPATLPELTEPQWRALLARDLRDAPLAWFSQVPAALLAALLAAAARAGRRDIIELLAIELPTALLDHVEQAFISERGSEDTGLAYLLEHAPADLAASICARLPPMDRLLSARADELTAVRRLLRRGVAARRDDFRACYAVLAELERRSLGLRRGALARSPGKGV